jgi:hypothetical protein
LCQYRLGWSLSQGSIVFGSWCILSFFFSHCLIGSFFGCVSILFPACFTDLCTYSSTLLVHAPLVDIATLLTCIGMCHRVSPPFVCLRTASSASNLLNLSEPSGYPAILVAG